MKPIKLKGHKQIKYKPYMYRSGVYNSVLIYDYRIIKSNGKPKQNILKIDEPYNRDFEKSKPKARERALQYANEKLIEVKPHPYNTKRKNKQWTLEEMLETYYIEHYKNSNKKTYSERSTKDNLKKYFQTETLSSLTKAKVLEFRKYSNVENGTLKARYKFLRRAINHYKQYHIETFDVSNKELFLAREWIDYITGIISNIKYSHSTTDKRQITYFEMKQITYDIENENVKFFYRNKKMIYYPKIFSSLFKIAYFTGLRRNEAKELRWNWIDYDKNGIMRITIPKAYCKEKRNNDKVIYCHTIVQDEIEKLRKDKKCKYVFYINGKTKIRQVNTNEWFSPIAKHYKLYFPGTKRTCGFRSFRNTYNHIVRYQSAKPLNTGQHPETAKRYAEVQNPTESEYRPELEKLSAHIIEMESIIENEKRKTSAEKTIETFFGISN